MAFKRSWTHVRRAAEPTTFAGKYGLKRVAGLTDVGKECFAIPLDMANGYSCLPYHTLKKNDSEGFHGSTFNSVKITCKRYDPETGEVSKELPLCCKLAQMEKDRIPEQEESGKRAITFASFRYVFPVLILSTTEDNPKKKPTLKKLSLNGIGFSFLDLAESSYEEEFRDKVISELVKAGEVDDPEEMEQEELMQKVADYVSHSIIKIANVAAKSPAIPYQKSFDIIPVTHKLIGAESGEQSAIRVLCKLLAGEYRPEQYDKIYAKYPALQEINNQVIDFLELYNDNVDSLVEPWNDEELQKYYNAFLAKQNQIEEYKKVNEAQRASEESEEVAFVGRPVKEFEDEDDEDDEIFAAPKSTVKKAVDPDVEDIDADFGDIDDEMESFDEIETPIAKPVKKAAPKKVAVAAGKAEISEDDFSMDDLETSSDLDSIESVLDEEFDEGEDSFEEDFD